MKYETSAGEQLFDGITSYDGLKGKFGWLYIFLQMVKLLILLLEMKI